MNKLNRAKVAKERKVLAYILLLPEERSMCMQIKSGGVTRVYEVD